MLAGIQSAVAGLQANDLQMDILGSRLGAEVSVPFPQVLDSTGTSMTVSIKLSKRRDDEEKGVVSPPTGQGGSSSQLPGLLPASTAAALGAGDPARDMGLYLIAQAAYRVNTRVFSAVTHELKILTRLGQ